MQERGIRRRVWLWAIGVPLAYFLVWNILAALNPSYSAERLLWPAEIAVRRIVSDPVSVPPSLVDRTLERLQKVVTRYPGSDAAGRAELLLGELYTARKEFDSARKTYRRIMVNYADKAQWVIEGYQAIARTYLVEEAWPKAMETYRTLLKEYPQSPLTMDVPLQMVAVARRHTADAGDAALEEAIAHYKKIIRDVPKGRLSFLASRRLAGCYGMAGRWEEALKTCETIVMDYPTQPEIPRIIWEAGELAKQKPHNPDWAQKISREFAERYPARRQAVERWLAPAVPKTLPTPKAQ